MEHATLEFFRFVCVSDFTNCFQVGKLIWIGLGFVIQVTFNVIRRMDGGVVGAALVNLKYLLPDKKTIQLSFGWRHRTTITPRVPQAGLYTGFYSVSTPKLLSQLPSLIFLYGVVSSGFSRVYLSCWFCDDIFSFSWIAIINTLSLMRNRTGRIHTKYPQI